MQNPPLAYFVEEDGKIYLTIKTDQTDLVRFQVSPQKAAYLLESLAGMLARSFNQREN